VTQINTGVSGADSFIYSTYLGGGGSDQGNGIAVLGRKIFVTGFTQSSDFPTSTAYQAA